MTVLRLTLVFFLATFLYASAALHPDQVVTLPNGEKVKILSTGQIEYSSLENAFFLRYQTGYSLEQRQALSDEVDALWKEVQADAEEIGLKQVVICSDYQSRTFLWISHATTNFIFAQGPDGRWNRLGRAEFSAAN